MIPTININDIDLRQVTLSVGSILTDREGGEGLIYKTKDEIVEAAILPAMEQFFTVFPLETDYEVEIAGDTSLDIPFPNENTFGITHINVVNRTSSSSAGSGFWQQWAFMQSLGNSMMGAGLIGGYGTAKNLNGSRHLRFLERAQIDTLENEGSFSFRSDYQNKMIKVYSSFTGLVYLRWASKSYNFSDIRFDRKREVINLARGYLMHEIGMMLSIIPDSGSAIEVDAGVLKEQGQKYIDDTLELWKDSPRIAIMRN